MKKKINIKKINEHITEEIMNDPVLFKKLDDLVQEERKRISRGENTKDLGIKRL